MDLRPGIYNLAPHFDFLGFLEFSHLSIIYHASINSKQDLTRVMCGGGAMYVSIDKPELIPVSIYGGTLLKERYLASELEKVSTLEVRERHSRARIVE